MEEIGNLHPNNTRVADRGQMSHTNGDRRASISPTSGFVAVNSRQAYPSDASIYNTSAYENSRTANVTIVNGTSLHGASATTRAELLSKFFTNSERASMDQDPSRRASISTSRPSGLSKSKPKPTTEANDYSLINSTSPVPIPNTPTSLLPQVKPSPADRFDDSGPYKVEMVARMEQLLRGDRIMPPCDRCRRLHMDCLKNLTACMGCTKKHAKCSWKDVVDDELRDNPFVPRTNTGKEEGEVRSDGDGFQNLPTISAIKPKDYVKDDTKLQQGVRDEELLGEDSADDDDQRDERVPVYHITGNESITSEAIPTISEANHSIPTRPPLPRKPNDRSTPSLPNPFPLEPTETPTQPPTTLPPQSSNQFPATSPSLPTYQTPTEEPDPGSPHLSVHAVGRSLEAEPDTPTTQNSADADQLADRERARQEAQRAYDQAVRDISEGKEGVRESEVGVVVL